MGHYRSESSSGAGDAHSSRSKSQVDRMGEGHRTKGRNGGDGMEAGYDSTSDVSHNRDSGNDGHDASDIKNIFHGVMEVLKKIKKIAHENDGGNDSREKDEVKGFTDEYESGSRNAAKGHRTGGRNGEDGMEAGDDSTSEVSHNKDSGNDGDDISDTKNVFHGVMEALKKFEKISHENEGGNDSREKDEVKGFRDEYESGSRTVAKDSKENEDKLKHLKEQLPKLWDEVQKHENLLQELSDLRNSNT